MYDGIVPQFDRTVEHAERLVILFLTKFEILGDVDRGAIVEMNAGRANAADRMGKEEQPVQIDPERVFLPADGERKHDELTAFVDDDRPELMDAVHHLQMLPPRFDIRAVFADEHGVDQCLTRFCHIDMMRRIMNAAYIMRIQDGFDVFHIVC